MGLQHDEFDEAFTVSQNATALVFQDRRHSKCIQDNVHHSIYVDALSLRFVDTEQFQRLRDVRQLGLCHLVYPGAVHTRFEHSLGTYYLADQAINRLKNFQGDELGIDWSDIKTVRLAGLLHDIGHGPFSHVFDNVFLPRILPGETWSHEQMSADMIDYIVDLHHIDIDREDLRKVKDMILASNKDPSHTAGGRGKRFIYTIVANGRNGIDVDKFDYIERDARACGLGTSFSYSRLMENMRVMDDEICFRAKEARNVYNLFQTRADLHRTVYSHAKVKALELMMADAFLLADNYVGISQQIHRPEFFWKLDDGILKAIETSEQPELEEARLVIQRIRRRQLYKFCNEYSVPKEMLPHFKYVTAKDIICAQTSSGVTLREEDVVVTNQKIDLTRGQEDPVSSVHFFKDYDSNEKFTIPKERISHLLPSCFIDRIVRVYSKKPELVKIPPRRATALAGSQKVIGRKRKGVSKIPESFPSKCASKSGSTLALLSPDVDGAPVCGFGTLVPEQKTFHGKPVSPDCSLYMLFLLVNPKQELPFPNLNDDPPQKVFSDVMISLVMWPNSHIGKSLLDSQEWE